MVEFKLEVDGGAFEQSMIKLIVFNERPTS